MRKINNHIDPLGRQVMSLSELCDIIMLCYFSAYSGTSESPYCKYEMRYLFAGGPMVALVAYRDYFLSIFTGSLNYEQYARDSYRPPLALFRPGPEVIKLFSCSA